MVVKIIEKEGRNPELKLSNMGKKEYAVIEKLYDEPLSGKGKNADGEFEWHLYTVALHEYKYFDDDAEEMKVIKNDTPLSVGFFKSAKTFREKFDKLPVNSIVTVTQVPVEGKAYSEFMVDVKGAGDAEAPEADKNAPEQTFGQYLANAKHSGLPKDQVIANAIAKFPEQTAETAQIVYESI